MKRQRTRAATPAAEGRAAARAEAVGYVSPTVDRAVREYVAERRAAGGEPTADDVIAALGERFAGNARVLADAAAYWTGGRGYIAPAVRRAIREHAAERRTS